jgi:hypothetical protein
MGSFYEETLHKLIYDLEGEVYFDRERYPDDWYLDTQKLLSQNESLAQKFYQVERSYLKNSSTLVKQINNQSCLQNEIWRTPIQAQDRRLGFLFKLGRLTQINFVAALVYYNNPPGNRKVLACQKMVKGMQALDYWFAKRNQLIHGAKGVSKLRMQEALEQDKQQPQNDNIRNTVPYACDANQILSQMTNIVRSALTLMGTTQPASVTDSNPADYLHPNKEPYYLYSDIREWVINTLNSDI